MPANRRFPRPRPVLVALALISAVFCALFPLGPGAHAEPIRAQIKKARADLVRFEQDLAGLASAFEGLQRDLDRVDAEVRTMRAILRRSERAGELYERAIADLVVRPLVSAELRRIQERREIIETLLPSLRREIWERASEREEKIETLEAAIELLEAARTGELVTKAGVGGGKLITYSADWAAVAECESSGRWHINVGLFDGGLQFLPSTWWGFGGGEYAPYAYQATRRQQIDIAERVLAVQGPNAWPNCFEALPVDTDE